MAFQGETARAFPGTAGITHVEGLGEGATRPLRVTLEPDGEAQVFRSAVELVSVKATVVDNRGRPVTGLASEHFRLEVDGRQRTIASAHFVGLGRGAFGTSLPPAQPEAVDPGTNGAMDEGRLILVAVDRAGIPAAEKRAALRALAGVIAGLAPEDRVAVTGLDDGGRLEFHTNRSQSRLELERLVGEHAAVSLQAGFSIGLAESLDIANGRRSRLAETARRECGDVQSLCSTRLEQEARATAQLAGTQATRSLDGIMKLLARLKAIERPKTVVLVSDGLVVEPPGMDLTTLGAAAHQAAVTIYALQLTPAFEVLEARDSPRWMDDIRRRADGLERLADVTGGALFRQVGADPEPLRRVLRELSGYYLLTFAPSIAERDDQPHRLRLSTTARGATLRSRTVFRLETADAARRRMEKRIVELLTSGDNAGDLPIRAMSYVFADPATGKVRLLVGAEVDESSGSASEATFAYVLQDGEGVIASSEVFDTPSDRFLSGAVAPPGRYTLRVAAVDRLGRAGSSTRTVRAVIDTSGLPTSDLVVARAGPGPDGSIDPVLEGTEDDQVFCYLELYPRPDQSLRNVNVTLSIRPATGGQVALSRPADVSMIDSRQATVRVTLPLSGLPAGPYVVRADVSDAGRAVGFVERPLTIVR